MRNNEVNLFGKGAYGINEWSVWSEGGTIYINANGGLYTEIIEMGKAGRTIKEQVQLRINARVRGKLDGGFKRTKEELGKMITNQLGLAMPMLASPLKSVTGLNLSKCYIQPKLDGHRCLINADGAYSRRGKVIETVPEIIDSLTIESGVTLDGELYYHGIPLQTIASWAKRRQPDTLKLQFHIYDVIIEGIPFHERLKYINSLLVNSQFVRIVDTVKLDTSIPLTEHWQKYRDNGFEGAILRPENSLYSIGKRSKELIKVKQRFDEEFKCVDVIPSREGLGILVLVTEEGKRFKTLAPGCNMDKRRALKYKSDFIGRYATCEYAERTKDNIPFHCVATSWRVEL